MIKESLLGQVGLIANVKLHFLILVELKSSCIRNQAALKLSMDINSAIWNTSK